MSTYLICHGAELDEQQSAAFDQAVSGLGQRQSEVASVRNVWIVDSRMKTDSIRKRLASVPAPADAFLVSELSADWRRRGLDQETRQWLRQHLLKAV